MSRTGFVKAVSEDGRRRLRVVVASRLREDHVDRIFGIVWLGMAGPLLLYCFKDALELVIKMRF
jgi:hypothetical protein